MSWYFRGDVRSFISLAVLEVFLNCVPECEEFIPSRRTLCWLRVRLLEGTSNGKTLCCGLVEAAVSRASWL